MSWLNKLLPPKIKKDNKTGKSAVPEGLWSKCSACEAVLYHTDLENNLHVCPKCSHHNAVGARARLDMLLDAEGRFEIGSEVTPVDILKFKDSKKYPERLTAAQSSTGEDDALVVMQGSINNQPAVVAAFEFRFIGGSMGSVVGEKISRAIDYCIENERSLIIISKSGGARMMEAAYSLMQMAKTSAKLTRLADAGLPYISLLTDPTTGGVTASYAMLGDLNISEPGALIGFAGPRVVKETIGKDLPKGFQTAEFVLEHGFLDFIVDRRELKAKISQVLHLLRN